MLPFSRSCERVFTYCEKRVGSFSDGNRLSTPEGEKEKKEEIRKASESGEGQWRWGGGRGWTARAQMGGRNRKEKVL